MTRSSWSVPKLDCPFSWEGPNDLEGQFPQTQVLAHRGGIAEKRFLYGVPQKANRLAGLQLTFGENSSLVHLPALNAQIGVGGAGYRGRPIGTAVDGLARSGGRGCHRLQSGDVVFDSRGVLDGELICTGAGSAWPAHPLSGPHMEYIAAQAGDVVGDLAVAPLPSVTMVMTADTHDNAQDRQ